LRRRRELEEKISGENRIKKIAVAGLIAGVALIITGLLFFPPLFVIGYTIFIICTGITSFTSVWKWMYGKTLKAEMKEKEKQPSAILCPRCGAEVGKNERYCPKCGKKTRTKKR